MPRIRRTASCRRPAELVALQFPQGEGKNTNLRVDAGVEAGDEVTPFYDPMIAKLIAHGANRDQALDRLADALENTTALGPRSNLGFLALLARAHDFRAGDFDTGFIDRHLAALGAAPQALDRAAVALGAQRLMDGERARIAASHRARARSAGFALGFHRRLSTVRQAHAGAAADRRRRQRGR